MISSTRPFLIGAGYLVALGIVVAAVFANAGVEPALLTGVAGAVLSGFVYFVARFLAPWRSGYYVLEKAVTDLEGIRAAVRTSRRPVTDLVQIGQILDSDLLIHAWTEFEDTLHAQADGPPDDLGLPTVTRYRQTVPASMYFSHSALIEVPLRTEFFKHLPGMLTGLGIIGTFLGLIIGLSRFSIGDTIGSGAGQEAITQVTQSTADLITSVLVAFFVSLFAIATAILITVLEKLLINRRIAQVAALCDVLDYLFDAGAGEEYLSRLVRASEEGATQTTQLKDALVAEISEVLERMTQMQIEALRDGARMQSDATRDAAKIIATEVSREITNTFEAPLRAMSESINATNSATQERVGEVLKDLLVQFSAQVESMFGDQMDHLAGLLQQTTVAMTGTLDKLDGLVEGMEQAGQSAVESMGTALQEQIAGIASQLGGEVARALGEVQSATSELQATMVAGQRELNDATQSAIGELTQQMTASTQSTSEATQVMRDTVTALSETTSEALEGFEASTRRLETAVGQIHQAGSALAANLNEVNEIVVSLRKASKTSAESLDAIGVAVSDMKSGAAEVSKSLAVVQEVLTSAERDAAATSELVKAVQVSANSLNFAQRSATEFLDGLEEALVKAHDDFARQVEQSLDASAKVFHRDLSKATSQLSGVVKELGEVLDEVLETHTPEA